MATTEEATLERGVGDNNPPSPFDEIKQQIEDLHLEAKNWLDGTGVQTEDDAEGVSRLLDELRKAMKAADELRKEEVKPHDEAKKAVQERYAPLIADTKSQRGIAVLAIDACKKALAPYLTRKEEERRAEAEKARKEAEEKANAAREAMQASSATDIEQREAAETMLQDAKRAEAAAKRVESSKTHATGGGRAVGLRTSYAPELVDGTAAARHYWQNNRAEMEAALMDMARKDVRAGKREIPGFKINEIKGVA